MSTVSADSVARIPDEIAKRVGRLVDVLEQQLADAQEDKTQAYRDLREELKAVGMTGKDITREVAAFKAAIAQHRRSDVDKAKLEAKDEGAAHYLTLIKAPRAHARAREAIEPQAQPVQTGAAPGTPTSNAGTEAVEAPAINSEIPSAEAEEAGEDVVTAASSPDTQSEPAEGFPTPTSAELGDRRTEASPAATVVPSNVTSIRSHNPATHFLNADGLARLHGCLKPELCGSGQPRVKLCFNCSVKHDGPTPQVEGGAA